MEKINVRRGIKLGGLLLTVGFVLLQPAEVAAQEGSLGANLANGILTGGTAVPVQQAVYGGGNLYRPNSLNEPCSARWYPNGTLCDELPTTHNPTISTKNTHSGATYSRTQGTSTGVLVVDLGAVQVFNQVNVFQMFSDGKTTHFCMSTHPETGAIPPDWQDTGWIALNGFDLIGPGANLGGSVTNPTVIPLVLATSRYVMVEVQNDGRYGSSSWTELRAFKLFNGLDTDEDGWADGADNCPAIANPEQGNNDGDDEGDVCDPDDDNDGTDDTADNCPLTSNSFQEDDDFDGLGNACDSTYDAGSVAQHVEDEASATVAILTELNVSGGNGLISKLTGNGGITYKVANAVSAFDAGLIDLDTYLSELEAALDKLNAFENQVNGKAGKPKGIIEPELSDIYASVAAIRSTIEGLILAAGGAL